jgi:hypothetical protein
MDASSAFADISVKALSQKERGDNEIAAFPNAGGHRQRAANQADSRIPQRLRGVC